MALVPPLRNFLASWMGLVTSLVFSDGVFSPLDGDLGMICNDTRDWLISDSIQTWVGGVEGTGSFHTLSFTPLIFQAFLFLLASPKVPFVAMYVIYQPHIFCNHALFISSCTQYCWYQHEIHGNYSVTCLSVGSSLFLHGTLPVCQ